MPQKSIFLDQKTISNVQKLANERGKKFSSMCSFLVEEGLRQSYTQEQFSFLREIELRNAENILRTLHVVSEMFYSMNDAPSRRFDPDMSPQDILSEIKRVAKQLVDKRR